MPAIVRQPKRARTDEGAVQQAIRERLGSQRDLVLWRNAQVHAEVWDENTANVRHVKGGLGEGSADLVGILTVRIDASRVLGRFFALEVKSVGARTAAARKESQEMWAANIRRRGGFVATVESPEEALAALERARSGAER